MRSICAYASALGSAEVRGQPQSSSLRNHEQFSLRQGLSLDGHAPSGYYGLSASPKGFSLIPRGWNYKCIPRYLTFNMSSGNWTQVLLLVRQALSGWVISQPEIDLGQWHNVLQTGHLKTKPFQGVSVHRVSFLKIWTYFHCVYACYMCMYVCRCGHPLLFEVRGRGWVSCSLTPCLIPMRQVISLSLEPNWPPASPRDPSVSVPPGTGIAAACPAMPSCVCLSLRV